tara:strand:+ start:2153 stop:2755 length:603 start_codon:yes stop_codon:yes gene_type:complete
MRPRQENITERIDRIKYEYEDSDKRPAHLDNKNIYSFEDQFNKNFKSIEEKVNDKKPTKKMSKQDEYNRYFNKKSDRYYKNRIATNPTQENLYEIFLQMKKAGELLPSMSFKEFEKNYRNLDIDLTKKNKKLPSKVDIDFDLPPSIRTAFIGLGPVIKDSALYKMLDNPKVLGVELGHESIIEIINLLNRSGLLKNGGRV